MSLLEVEMAGGIGQLWKPVVNVWDLDAAEAFYSQLSGMQRTLRLHQGTFSMVCDELGPDGPIGQWILLQLVPDGQRGRGGGTHLDFRVEDVREAVEAAIVIGARVIKPVEFFPSDNAPLEWAVLEDPFGNEFCLVRWPLPPGE